MPPGAVAVWLTTADQEHLLARQPDLERVAEAAAATIRVDDHEELQPMVGFGASFTESAAVLLHDGLETGARAHVMERLFHPDRGIGLCLLRQPMGATDFSIDNYTYDDVAGAGADVRASRWLATTRPWSPWSSRPCA